MAQKVSVDEMADAIIERGHADSRRQVDAALVAELKGYRLGDALYRVLDIYDKVADSEGVHQQLRHVDVALLTAGHQHADDAVLSQRFDAERRDDRAVLAAGDTDDGVAALAVLLKEIAYPLYALVFGFFRVEVIHRS